MKKAPLEAPFWIFRPGFALSRLLFLTGDTNRGPGDRIQPREADFLFAHRADAKVSVLDPGDGSFDRAKQLRIRLTQFYIDVHLIVITGLVDEIPATRT